MRHCTRLSLAGVFLFGLFFSGTNSLARWQDTEGLDKRWKDLQESKLKLEKTYPNVLDPYDYSKWAIKKVIIKELKGKLMHALHIPYPVSLSLSLYNVSVEANEISQYLVDVGEFIGEAFSNLDTWHNDEFTIADYQYRQNLRQNQLLYQLKGNKEAYQDLVRRRHNFLSGVVRTDRQGQTTQASSATQPLEKRKKLNAAIDDYESEKYAPGDKVEIAFKSKYEKMSYDNTMEALNTDIKKDSQTIEEKQVELSRLRGQIRQLDERVSHTVSTIEELKSRRQKLLNSLEKEHGSRSGTKIDIEKTNKTKGSLAKIRKEKRRLFEEIDRVNEGIAAEEARYQSLQSQHKSASSGVVNLLGALSLAGNVASLTATMSPSSYKARSRVYNDTRSYARSAGRSKETGESMPDWDAYAKRRQAEIKKYVHDRLADRAREAEQWKQRVYRKRLSGN